MVNIYHLIGFALGFPLFFTTGLAVFRGDSASNYELSIPLSLFVVSGLAFFGVVRNFSNILIPLALFAWVALVVISSNYVNGFSDPSLMLIYLVPMLAGFMLPIFSKAMESGDFSKILNGFAGAMLVSAVLHIGSSIISYGIIGTFAERGADSIFGLFSIYQKYSYYPTLLAIGSFVIMAQWKGRVRWLAWSLIVFDIMICGARESIVLAIYFLVVAGDRKDMLTVGKRATVIFVCTVALLTLSVIFLGEEMKNFVFLEKITDIIFASDARSVTAGRSEVAVEVMSNFDISGMFYLIGSGFSTSTLDIGTPHNQYLEWFIRGGFLFVLGNLMLLGAGVWRSMRSSDRVHRNVGLILIGSVVISNNINTPYRVPYTAVLLWVLVGFSCLATLSKSDRRISSVSA